MTISLTLCMVVMNNGHHQVDGNTLSSTELSLVSMGEKVEVASNAWIRVDASRKVVENILDSGETVYGINTGFGALVSESIFQKI